MTDAVVVGWSKDVCSVTLNRPSAGNALSADLVGGLDKVLDECVARRPQLMVVRGDGKHFCTGFDLAHLDDESDDSLLARFCRIELLLQKVRRASFPTLALAHGRAMGAGADLFAACTHRLAAPGTQFAFPGAAGFGLVLGTRRLVERVGSARVTRWVTTGASIALDEALAAGLATGTLPEGSPEQALPGFLESGAAAAIENPLLASAFGADDRSHDHLDLSLLVRSAAIPGLKARIAAYVKRSRQVNSSTQPS
jgi:enoyl-CoA hydratase